MYLDMFLLCWLKVCHLDHYLDTSDSTIDVMINKTVISRFLRQLGVSFDVASTGQEAAELFEKKHYHFVLIGMVWNDALHFKLTLGLRS